MITIVKLVGQDYKYKVFHEDGCCNYYVNEVYLNTFKEFKGYTKDKKLGDIFSTNGQLTMKDDIAYIKEDVPPNVPIIILC